MHWRGDRAEPAGHRGLGVRRERSRSTTSTSPSPGCSAATASSTAADMQKFTDFALQIMLPPNPVRALDNSLTPAQQRGHDFFVGPRLSDGIAGTLFGQQLGFTCEGCHRLQPSLGHFGTDGRASFENEQQIVKIPHLRNLYQKVGMFGGARRRRRHGRSTCRTRARRSAASASCTTAASTRSSASSTPPCSRNDAIGGPNVGFQNDTAAPRHGAVHARVRHQPRAGRRPADHARPATNGGVVGPRIDLLIARAALGECDLVVKGVRRRRGARLDAPAPAARSPATALPRRRSRDGDAARRGGAPARSSPTPACRRARASAPASIATRTATSTATSSTPARTRPIRASAPGYAIPSVLVPSTTLIAQGRRRTRRSIRASGASCSRRSRKEAAAGEPRSSPPLPGSAGDPTVGGATLDRLQLGGTHHRRGDRQPARHAAGARSAARQPEGMAVPRRCRAGRSAAVLVKSDRIVVRGGEGAWGYTLDEAAQGRVAVRLRLGTDPGWCTESSPKLKGNPPSTATSDRPGCSRARGTARRRGRARQHAAEPGSTGGARCPRRRLAGGQCGRRTTQTRVERGIIRVMDVDACNRNRPDSAPGASGMQRHATDALSQRAVREGRRGAGGSGHRRLRGQAKEYVKTGGSRRARAPRRRRATSASARRSARPAARWAARSGATPARVPRPAPPAARRRACWARCSAGCSASSEPDPTYRNFVEKCLRDKGYEPIGWT